MLFPIIRILSSILISAISRTVSEWFIVRFQEVGYVQGGSMVESMYAVQSAMEIALKNSMLVSNLKTHGKSPRFFYLDPVDPRKAERILGENLLRTFRNVRTNLSSWRPNLIDRLTKIYRKINFRASDFPRLFASVAMEIRLSRLMPDWTGLILNSTINCTLSRVQSRCWTRGNVQLLVFGLITYIFQYHLHSEPRSSGQLKS